jgi:hypothetical protein
MGMVIRRVHFWIIEKNKRVGAGRIQPVCSLLYTRFLLQKPDLLFVSDRLYHPGVYICNFYNKKLESHRWTWSNTDDSRISDITQLDCWFQRLVFRIFLDFESLTPENT